MSGRPVVLREASLSVMRAFAFAAIALPRVGVFDAVLNAGLDDVRAEVFREAIGVTPYPTPMSMRRGLKAAPAGSV